MECSKTPDSSGFASVDDIGEFVSMKTGSDSTAPKDIPSIRSAGRPVERDTKFLRHFFMIVKQNSSRPPRREHMRIQFFRGFVTCISRFAQSRPLIQRINKNFSVNDYLYKESLDALQQFYLKHKFVVDAALSQFLDREKAGFPSFSTRLFRKVLATEEMRQCFRLYSDFLFAEPTPEVMTKRLRIMCCLGASHSPECEQNWVLMRNFYRNRLFLSALK